MSKSFKRIFNFLPR